MSEKIKNNLFKVIYLVILIVLILIMINEEKINHNSNSAYTGMEQFNVDN